MNRVKRIIVVIGSIASTLFLGILIGGFYFWDEFFLTEADIAPLVLPLTAVNFDGEDDQVPFEIVRPGRYRVMLFLKLRSDPEPCEPRELKLSGVLEINDGSGTVRFHRTFSMDLSQCVIGFDVATFYDSDVGGVGRKILSLHLVPPRGFMDQYSKVEVGIIRKPRWQFMI